MKRILTISRVMFLSVIIVAVGFVFNNIPSKAIFVNGNRYINQNVIVPDEYRESKIGSKSGYAYWKIIDRSEEDYMAVKVDDAFYLYQTKTAKDLKLN